MPDHDWTRVDPGVFHDFHTAWLAELRKRLNGGVLPEGYYALVERVAGDVVPDILTLSTKPTNGRESGDELRGTTAAALAPPRVRFSSTLENHAYLELQREIVIHRQDDDKIVALIEVVSKGNKSGRQSFRSFVEKCCAALRQGIHLLVLDLYPPTPRDPQGIHGSICSELGEEEFQPPADKPLTLASYAAAAAIAAYVEPLAVQDALIPMPLFLHSDHYVDVPLEETYQSAFDGVPRNFRAKLEAIV